MKAIEILNVYLKICLKIAEDYNKKARFALSEGDMTNVITFYNIANSQLEKAAQHQEAIDELKSMLTLKSA